MMNSAIEISSNYVSQKISKIRYPSSSWQTCSQPDIVVCGTWDDEANAVRAFQLSLAANLEQGSINLNGVAQFPIAGDVTDLHFVDEHNLLATTSFGHCMLLSFYVTDASFHQLMMWNKLHRIGNRSCSCTCVSVQGEHIATGGEDGRINLLRLDSRHDKPVQVLGDHENQSAIYALDFLTSNELVAGNAFGQLVVRDVRQKDVTSLVLPLCHQGQPIALTSLALHSTQKHVVAAGAQNGTIAVWDLRNSKVPAAQMIAHTGPVWELKFHPLYSDMLLSCSEDGTLLQWDASLIRSSWNLNTQGGNLGNPWLLGEAASSRLQVTSLLENAILPLNCLDIATNSVVFAGDAECIYIAQGLFT